jgi:hypothetical protein
MKVIAISDLHGSLPEMPECDLLLIGGDICPVEGSHDPFIQENWLNGTFRPWLKKQPAKHIVGIAGNHDFAFEEFPVSHFNHPSYNWTYLQDTETEIEGLRIYGTPWVPNLRSWAFHGGMGGCYGRFERIPEGIDILLSHGPMHGHADYINQHVGRVGCTSMADEVERIHPKVFICGHIHEGRGIYTHHKLRDLKIYNVAHMNEMYDPVGEPMEIEL